MERYRSTGALDDPPLTEGDDGWVGIDSYNSAENLQPGLAQAAVNVDFTTQDAQTRGGFVCIPSLGSAPFSSIATWTSRTNPENNQWRGVAYGNGVFVAIAESGVHQVMTSSDAITWTARTAAAALDWAAITFGNGTFVAVAESPGGSGQRVMTSTDGTTWTQRSTPGTTNDWEAIVYGNGLFVAVASSGTGDRVMTSPDGATWTIRVSAGDKSWTSIAYGNGLFVAVAAESTTASVMTSPDGIVWTMQTAAAANFWHGIAFGNNTFVAVSTNGSGVTHDFVMTSEDGVSWTSRAPSEDNEWRAITFGNFLFVAVASTGTNRIMTSNDGIIWTARTSAAANQWYAVANGNNTFVAVSQTGAGDMIMTSGSTSAGFACGIYSDPSDPGSQWIMMAMRTKVVFCAFGRTTRTVNIDAAQTVSQISTVVQCNNLVYLFRGVDETPLYWTGNWGDEFELAPTPAPGTGFSIIPNSNQAVYYQNRLWVINGKDIVSASDVLDFEAYDDLADAFNLNTGSSDFLVTTYPFGTTTLVVFKNKSIIALTAVDGVLTDVIATEITRQVGAIGINSVVSVGADLVYMSDRNINLLTLTSTSNALQHKTLPLSTPIQSIIRRVNWQAASKVSMGYTDNKLYVALPLDNSTTCNAVVVYNFVTGQWFGEWAFAASLGMAIQGWVVANYLGVQRMHCITEDGRIFVTGEGHQDISGATVAEVATSLTTRAYRMDNNNRINRRMWVDLSTNRPDFSVTSYVDGANEYSEILSGQTFSRADSWIFSDSAYSMDNSNDDYNRAGRQDYSSGPASIESGTGFLPEMTQDYRFPILTRGKGRLTWFNVSNETGFISVNGIGAEARAGDRSSLVQVL